MTPADRARPRPDAGRAASQVDTSTTGATASDPGPHPGVQVRIATPDDIAALMDLRTVMFEAMGTPAVALSDPGWRLAAHRWFAERLDAAEVRIVVAEVEGRVASGAVGEITHLIPGPTAANGTVGLISNVATLAPWRGLGLAAACTDDLLRWFVHDTDVTRVDLFATEAGARIYGRRGFRRRGFPAMSRAVERHLPVSSPAPPPLG